MLAVGLNAICMYVVKQIHYSNQRTIDNAFNTTLSTKIILSFIAQHFFKDLKSTCIGANNSSVNAALSKLFFFCVNHKVIIADEQNCPQMGKTGVMELKRQNVPYIFA